MPCSPAAIPGVPKSDRRPVWRKRRFFISSVVDSVLERSAALESFASASGLVALSELCLFITIILM